MSIKDYYKDCLGDKAKLRKFFAEMPKGADLHNHLTGAAYAETLFAIAYREHLFVNMETGKLVKKIDPYDPDAEKYIQLTDETFAPDEHGYKKHDFHFTRTALLDLWSVRDFQPYKYPLGADEYFFSLFGNFIAAAGKDYLPEIVHNLKVRAKEENLQYIETMGMNPTVPPNAFLDSLDPQKYEEYSSAFKMSCQEYHMEPGVEINDDINKILAAITGIIIFYEDSYNKSSDLYNAVTKYIEDCVSILAQNKDKVFVTRKFDTVQVSDSDVLMKLLGYASRNKDPFDVLCQLYIVHKAMQVRPDVIIGCNIVAAENSENSMQYYKLHMLMFYVLKNWFIGITGNEPNTSLHAGELTMGLIPPEHLTYHVNDAVFIAGAKRIGHGVDIAFEHNSEEALCYMATNKIPIEINLTSNEFILGVKDDIHPFNIYKKYNVPIIISTDDPGILRTSITEEYALAAYRYNLTYDEVKDIVSNSIEYSFLSKDDKDSIRGKYTKALEAFEDKYRDYPFK